jgi:exonuclease VII small subunit
MIVDQIEYLYENLDTADQKPGRDAYQRYEELLAQLQEQVQKLDRIVAATDAAVGSR